MSYIEAGGRLLSVVLAGGYVVITVLLLSTWAFLYHEPGKSLQDIVAVLLWPVLGLRRLVRWSFTGKWDRERQ